jgi:hypothetical protein
VFPVIVPPLMIATCPVFAPAPTINALSIALLNVLSANPAMFRSNTKSSVVGWLWFWLTVTNPLKLVNVTALSELNVWVPIKSAAGPEVYKPSDVLLE